MTLGNRLTYVYPIPKGWGLGGRIASHIGRRMRSLLIAIGSPERDFTRKHWHKSVGVLTADWEYITGIAPRFQKDSWSRLLLGETRR